MRTAILLVSFGTSHEDARENSLEKIYEDMVRAGGGIPVFQAYTSGIILKELAARQVKMNTIDEAVKEALDSNIECLYVIPTHMIPGSEYHKMMQALGRYESVFKEMKIASPVLAGEKDCDRLVPILRDMFRFEEDREYILMGHGTEAAANVRYEQMNSALIRAGLHNVCIASVEAKPDLEDAIASLHRKKEVKKVIVHPFMIVAGDHAKNDMAGEKDSYVSGIREEGYAVEAVVKGLGEYPQFRRIYADKLEKMMKGSKMASGILYGVGVGPGDPESITFKAVRIMRECDMIGIPAKDVSSCTAYKIALQAAPEIADKPVLCVPIPMTTDRQKLEKAYAEGCECLKEQLEKGKSIAFLNLGDPTVYSTYMGIHERVQKAGYDARLVSGVPSFCAVAAVLDQALGTGKENIHILPGCYHPEELTDYNGTRILMKSGSKIGEVKRKLAEMEASGEISACAVTNCGMESQIVCRKISELSEEAGYFTTIIVKDNK